MHHDSMVLMRYFRDKYLDQKNITVLDVGSRIVAGQHKSYRNLFKDYNYVGMDIVAGQNVDIIGYKSLENKTFDVVISGQVMEHVKRPWEWLKSLSSCFTKYICIVAPHTFKEHRFPIDTYRYLPDGMRDLFDYANIKEVEIVKNKTSTMGIGQ